MIDPDYVATLTGNAQQYIRDLEDENARLRERYHEQTKATQESADFWHNQVLTKLEGRIPEGIDPHGHPIEQIVGCVLSVMDGNIEDIAEECDRLRDEVKKREEYDKRVSDPRKHKYLNPTCCESGCQSLVLSAEIERLREIVERLPKTADGVPVVPGMDEVYEVCMRHDGTTYIRKTGLITTDPMCGFRLKDLDEDVLYSTREAAEKVGGR